MNITFPARNETLVGSGLYTSPSHNPPLRWKNCVVKIPPAGDSKRFCITFTVQRSTVIALPHFFVFSFSLPQFLLYAKKNFTSLSYFSKTASPWCFWLRLTVTECRSRWIIPSIQTAAIVIFKRADICWRARRGSFQRNDESLVLDCSERGPHEWLRMWQEGWKGERERPCSTVLSHLISPFCVISLFFSSSPAV